MQDIYQLLKPVFDSEEVLAALRSVCLARQASLAAALRKEPDSAAFGLKAIRVHSQFNQAVISAFLNHQIPDPVIDALGYHSFLFFGINPRVFEIAVLAIHGMGEYDLETYEDIIRSNQQVDINAIIRGEENLLDSLLWLRHIGNNFATYMVECHQAAAED